jgi:hypothetical protein
MSSILSGCCPNGFLSSGLECPAVSLFVLGVEVWTIDIPNLDKVLTVVAYMELGRISRRVL